MTPQRADGTIEEDPVLMLALVLTVPLPDIKLSNRLRCLSIDDDLPDVHDRSCCCLLLFDKSLLLGAGIHTLFHGLGIHISLQGAFSLRVQGANRTLFLDILLLQTETSLPAQELEDLSAENIASDNLELGYRDGNELVPAPTGEPE